MEITRTTAVPGLPRKPLDNPPRPKSPKYASDAECAALLAAVLATVPTDLRRARGSAFPLLDALIDLDARRGTDSARQLVFIAAATHRTADERRTAEYLLRNSARMASGERSTLALLAGARCAAEMDVRRVQLREIPVPRQDLSRYAADRPARSTDTPSVGEMVIHKLSTATGGGPPPLVTGRILDALPVVLELAERHRLNGGTGPSLLGMRTDARTQSRLVTHLRALFSNDVVARNIARLLVGADETPIETALLWWSTLPDLAVADVPGEIRRRWSRYVRTTQAAIHTNSRLSTASQSGLMRPGAFRLNPAHRTNGMRSARIPDTQPFTGVEAGRMTDRAADTRRASR